MSRSARPEAFMTARPLAILACIGPGIGLAVARRLALAGHDLALIARRRAALEDHASVLRGLGARVGLHPADLSEKGAAKAIFDEIGASQGEAEVLVHNGGVRLEKPAMALEPDDLERTLTLCVGSALVAAQAVLPGMKARGRGTMLFTGSGLALAPREGAAVPALVAGKCALRGLVLAMAPELAVHGVRCVTITVAGPVAPGTAFAPDRIAERFVDVVEGRAPEGTAEIVFRGAEA
jgi:short-subunit dehydrogenase